MLSPLSQNVLVKAVLKAKHVGEDRGWQRCNTVGVAPLQGQSHRRCWSLHWLLYGAHV
jgi:hypothetical protein